MSGIEPRAGAALNGRKIAVLMESDYVEPEIFYYERRFAEAGAEVHFMTRLWGQSSITFTGHEWRVPFTVDRGFEGISDRELRSYAAVIVPSGIVSDRLRFTDDVNRLAPATAFVRRALEEPSIITGVICHGLWLMAAAPETMRGRKVVAHNNLVGDVRNMGAEYVDQDVVIDGNLITGRSVYHCHLFAHTIIGQLAETL
ncbi:DJ-1/PfpI family protein [Nonomuraea sp. NPDC048881]|uniref:DJ-1/PfpI family protein n=1 Tax=unclassified Nonomuraea TaxID=2593643 RepID=UPI0033F2C4D3